VVGWPSDAMRYPSRAIHKGPTAIAGRMRTLGVGCCFLEPALSKPGTPHAVDYVSLHAAALDATLTVALYFQHKDRAPVHSEH